MEIDYIAAALAICANAHSNQVDKAGTTYCLHPIAVMGNLKNGTEAEMVAALLHDVVEDSHWTLDKLRTCGFSEDILTAVDILTHKKEDHYDVYIKKIAMNKMATKVKIADLTHNMDKSRLGVEDPEIHIRQAKYMRAKNYLTNDIMRRD